MILEKKIHFFDFSMIFHVKLLFQTLYSDIITHTYVFKNTPSPIKFYRIASNLAPSHSPCSPDFKTFFKIKKFPFSAEILSKNYF